MINLKAKRSAIFDRKGQPPREFRAARTRCAQHYNAVTGLMHDGEFVLAPRQAVIASTKTRLIATRPGSSGINSRNGFFLACAMQLKKTPAAPDACHAAAPRASSG